MPKKIAIMQPTYLPWLGYLAMIERADQFVFLDNVQFDHRSWQQRNRIKTTAGELWLTISVKQKGLGHQLIKDVNTLDVVNDLKKHLKSLLHAYRKADHFEEFYNRFDYFLNDNIFKCSDSIANINIEIIKFVCDYIGLKGNFLRASDLSCEGQKGELLANICEYLGASTYLSPPGSKGYLDECNLFSQKNIIIDYNNYVPVEYKQLHGSFIPGLSCVDAFFNVKRSELKTLILKGCQ